MQTTWTFLSDRGRRIWVRPLCPTDVPYLIDIFDHLSPESRYQRFNELLDAPEPNRIQAEAKQIAAMAPDQGHGWLAFANIKRKKTAVGGVRWVRVSDEVAEVALTVRDDFQGQGIGRELVRLALEDARATGIHKINAVFQGGNQAVTQLLRHSPIPLEHKTLAGQVYIEVDLTHSTWME